MGIQFYHFEAYSRAISKSKTSKKGKSVYTVIGEAERTLGYCDHVTAPKEPVVLFGIPFSDVAKLAEEYAGNTFDSCGRAVRKNGLCMIAGIVSAPSDMTEKVWNVFKKAAIEYLQKSWGDSLKSVIEHLDENFDPDPEDKIKPGTLHRHFHFACVPPTGVNFKEIHPGIKAKRAADKAYGVTKKPDELDERGFEIFKKEGRQAGDRAYRNAMKLVQDDFFARVSNPFGLLRYGPKRLRLSREEIIRRNHEKRLKQKLVVELSDQEEQSKEQAEKIAKTKSYLEKLQSQKKSIEEKLKTREKTVAAQEKEIIAREKAVAIGEQRQADFDRGLKSSLKGWELPKPTVGEFAGHYIKRVTGEVMGKVQRAMNAIKEYGQKKAELEAEAQERQKKEAARIAVAEKAYSDQIRGLKSAYQKLKNRILGIKTPQELVALQKELSHDQQRHSGR